MINTHCFIFSNESYSLQNYMFRFLLKYDRIPKTNFILIRRSTYNI